MSTSIVHHVSVFADNYQFQIQDAAAECEYPDTWNDEIVTCMLGVGNHVIGVGTVRDLDCEIEIEVFDEPLHDEELVKAPDLVDWDHVAQTVIDLPSGKIVITGPAGMYDEVELEVRPGRYGMRVFWSGLDSQDDLGFEGDDKYKIAMWPDTEFETRVLKIWKTLESQLSELL